MRVLFGLLLIVPVILADAPQPSLQELIKDGQDKFEKALSDIKKQVGLSENPNGEEIVKVIKQRNDQLAKDIKELGKKVEEQVKTKKI